jgi:DNA-binding NtrC family response regulator
MASEIQHDPLAGSGRSASELRLEDLEHFSRSDNGSTLPLRDWVALAEAWRIARALREHRGNRSATARALGIGRRTLYTKMEKLGLEPSWGIARPSEPARLGAAQER